MIDVVPMQKPAAQVRARSARISAQMVVHRITAAELTLIVLDCICADSRIRRRARANLPVERAHGDAAIIPAIMHESADTIAPGLRKLE
jgi:hypothetical protein